MKKTFVVAALAAALSWCAPNAYAQITAQPSPPCGKPSLAIPVGSSATFNWAAPTTFTDGTTISGAITYSIYSVGGANPVLLQAGLTSPTSTRTNLSAGTPCYAITSTVNGAESVLSQTIALLVAEVPGPPKTVTCTITLPTSVTGPTPAPSVCTVQ